MSDKMNEGIPPTVTDAVEPVNEADQEAVNGGGRPPISFFYKCSSCGFKGHFLFGGKEVKQCPKCGQNTFVRS